MNHTRHFRTGTVGLRTFALLATLSLAASPLAAHDFTVGDLELLHPSAPPTPPGASSAAGYLVIVNSGTADDRLLGGSASFARDIEMHRTTIEDDVMRMRRLDDGLPIPAGTTVRLDPGETHLMFTGLAEALPDGEKRRATLVFEQAGSIDIEFAIERIGADDAPQPADAMEHGAMEHDAMSDEAMNHDAMEHESMEPASSEPKSMDHDSMKN